MKPSQTQPFLHHVIEERNKRTQEQKKSRRFLWGGLAFGAVVMVVLSTFVLYVYDRFNPQPLRADTNTLYLADWSKGFDGWSGGKEWQWKQPGVIGTKDVPSDNDLLLAPYHASNTNVQIDMQLKVIDPGWVNDDSEQGIAIGVGAQGQGYRCGYNLLAAIELLQENSSSAGVSDYRESNDTSDTWGNGFRTFTVTIRNNVITLFFDGQQVAQAIATAYDTAGSLGLYANGDMVEVQSFRIDKLL